MPEIPFLTRVQSGKILVADGATGTNLIDRGLPTGQVAESWVIDQPDQIIRLHKDFIDAGADILLTSTFNASSIRLKNSSLEGQTDLIVHKAVEHARSAASASPVYVAGSLGPVGGLIKPYGPLTVDEIVSAYAEQAEAHTDAGADLLVIETQFDLGEVKAGIQGVRQVSTLPLVVSLSYDRGLRTMMGVSPAQAAKALDDLQVDIIGINCGHSLEENLKNLVELRNSTSKPIWFKPNAGLPRVDPSGKTVYDVSPTDMGMLVPAWLAAGASIVGGCCGTTPQHLQEIANRAKL
jgi:5-methyltetrahydrofolate--homocysteine methyltransferase